MTGFQSAIAIAAVAALSATAAIAAPADAKLADTVSVKVSLAGLDLSQDNGAAAALGRIDGAARVICGEAPSIMDLGGSSQYRQCIAAAVENGVNALGSPLVTAMDETRHNRQPAYQLGER